MNLKIIISLVIIVLIFGIATNNVNIENFVYSNENCTSIPEGLGKNGCNAYFFMNTKMFSEDAYGISKRDTLFDFNEYLKQYPDTLNTDFIKTNLETLLMSMKLDIYHKYRDQQKGSNILDPTDNGYLWPRGCCDFTNWFVRRIQNLNRIFIYTVYLKKHINADTINPFILNKILNYLLYNVTVYFCLSGIISNAALLDSDQDNTNLTVIAKTKAFTNYLDGQFKFFEMPENPPYSNDTEKIGYFAKVKENRMKSDILNNSDYSKLAKIMTNVIETIIGSDSTYYKSGISQDDILDAYLIKNWVV